LCVISLIIGNGSDGKSSRGSRRMPRAEGASNGDGGYEDDDMDLVSVDGRKIERKFKDAGEMHVRDDYTEQNFE
jgi:hypothetical protein